MASKGLTYGLLATGSAAAAMAAVILTLPAPPVDHTFDHIKLPANYNQCLPDKFNFAARFDDKSDFDLNPEERNALKLDQKKSEVAAAEATYRWLIKLEDPAASQQERDAALNEACAAGRAIKGQWPKFQVTEPLTSVQMGDNWVARYNARDYERTLNSVQGEQVKLEQAAVEFQRARALPAKAAPAGPFVRQPAVQPKKPVAPKSVPAKGKKRSELSPFRNSAV